MKGRKCARPVAVLSVHIRNPSMFALDVMSDLKVKHTWVRLLDAKVLTDRILVNHSL